MKWKHGGAVGDGSMTTGFSITGSGAAIKWDSMNASATVVDAETQKVEIFDSAVQGWAVCGNVNGSSWDQDFAMKQEGDIWTSEALTIAYDGTDTWGCKVRKYTSWTLNYGLADDVAVEVNKPLALKAGGGNITYNGKAKIVFDEKNLTVTVVPAE